MSGVTADAAWAWRTATAELVARTRFITPGRLPEAVAGAAASAGSVARLYLVDYEQRKLRPFSPPPAADGGDRPDGTDLLHVDGSPAGTAFRTTTPERDGSLLWYPLLDGSERLGVLALDAVAADRSDPAVRAEVDRFSALVGHLIAVMAAYGDAFERVRRTRPMSPAAELVWQMLPPLTYGADNFVIAAILQPVYTVGGDGFDYGSLDSTLHLAIFDSTGHHLRAGLTTAVALSATRAARRAGGDVVAQARAADEALAGEYRDSRFTTAVLAAVDLTTGIVRYVNAGHPPPLVLRGDRVVGTLDGGRRVPLGLGGVESFQEGEIRLEPGDRLLAYSDGVVDALGPDGAPFGVDQLIELAVRHAAHGLPAPETLRRMNHDVLSRYDGPPADDATLLLVEWSGEAVRRLAPNPGQAQ
jgi:phosphoserine phosphatase RsbU/P